MSLFIILSPAVLLCILLITIIDYQTHALHVFFTADGNLSPRSSHTDTISELQSESYIGRNNITFLLTSISYSFMMIHQEVNDWYPIHILMGLSMLFPMNSKTNLEKALFITHEYSNVIHMMIVAIYLFSLPFILSSVVLAIYGICFVIMFFYASKHLYIAEWVGLMLTYFVLLSGI